MAATATPLPARSIHGCWTCRLRKKKCDEGRPSCSTCVHLDLDCHGYGPRPLWMDHGILQKVQALEFKRIVSQAKAKKLRQRVQRPTQLSRNSYGLQFDQVSSETVTPLVPEFESTTSSTQSGNTVQDNIQFPGFGTRVFDNIVWGSLVDETLSPSQQFFFEDKNVPTNSKDDIPDPLEFHDSGLDMNILFSQPQSTSVWPAGLEYNICYAQVRFENSFFFSRPIRYDSSNGQNLQRHCHNDALDLTATSEGHSSLTFGYLN